MANSWYPKWKEALLGADVDWLADNIKAVAVDTALYTYSSSHQFLSDIAAGARIATSGNLAGKTATSGVMDADDVTFSAVSGASVEAIVLYHDTGVAGTSRLILYLDTATSGLPFTPDGSNRQVIFDAAGIAAL